MTPMSKGAHAAATSSATFRVLRELGRRAQRAHAAVREASDVSPSAPKARELVVLHRFGRSGSPKGPVTSVSAEAMAILLRDARSLERAWHPNVTKVRHVELLGGELSIATEFVDGATLEDLADASPEPLPIAVLTRILLDVLAGAQALHGLRDGRGEPSSVTHGALCPTNVVVGRDGVARLVDALRPRPVRVTRASEALGYAAPEAVDVGGTDDVRADIYAVGVILWEAIAGRRLYEERDPAKLLVRQRQGDLPSPIGRDRASLAGLAAVAMRALSFDPGSRYRSAAEMTSALRAAAEEADALASGSAVAALVSELSGDRIRDRRGQLDPALSGTRRKPSAGAIATAHAAAARKRGALAAGGAAATVKRAVFDPDAPQALVLEDLIDVDALASLAAPISAPNAHGSPSTPERSSGVVPTTLTVPTLEAEIPVALLAASLPDRADPDARETLPHPPAPGPHGAANAPSATVRMPAIPSLAPAATLDRPQARALTPLGPAAAPTADAATALALELDAARDAERRSARRRALLVVVALLLLVAGATVAAYVSMHADTSIRR